MPTRKYYKKMIIIVNVGKVIICEVHLLVELIIHLFDLLNSINDHDIIRLCSFSLVMIYNFSNQIYIFVIIKVLSSKYYL
jgi:hypothetical protein